MGKKRTGSARVGFFTEYASASTWTRYVFGYRFTTIYKCTASKDLSDLNTSKVDIYYLSHLGFLLSFYSYS